MPTRKPQPKLRSTPKISIIVKAGADLAELEATLLCLGQFRRSEILVYLPSSGVASAGLLELLGRYRIRKPFSPTTKSSEWQLLNELAARARGEIIVFLDTAFFPSAYVEKTLAFKLSSPFVVGGTLVSTALNHSLVSGVWEYVQRLTSHVLGFMSGQEILFVKKAVFMKLGGFKPFPLRRAYAALLERLGQEGRIVHIKTAFSTQFDSFKDVLLKWPLYFREWLWGFFRDELMGRYFSVRTC